MIKLMIPGEPAGKGRPRLGKFGNVHTPEKTLNYEAYIKWIFAQGHYQMLKGNLGADITAFFSIPKSASKKKAQQMKDAIIRPTKKPDVDNIAKICLDALNKLAYHDDSSVVALTVDKYYSDNPRVEIVIYELD